MTFARFYPGIGMYVIGASSSGGAPSAADAVWRVALVEDSSAPPRTVVADLPLADAAYMAEHHAAHAASGAVAPARSPPETER